MNTQPTITIRNDPVPEDFPGTIETQLLHQPTDTNPATVQIVFTNTATKTLWFIFGFTPPFSQYYGQHERGTDKLLIVPLIEPFLSHVPDTPTDGCWTSIDVPGILESGTITELEPNEQVSRRYALLNHPNNKQCFPSGTYTFEDTIGYEGNQQADSEHQWRFTITVV